MSLKNITLSADERLIEKARVKAQQQRSSLNVEFRAWLERYVKSEDGTDLNALMKRLAYVKAGGPFTREELNER